MIPFLNIEFRPLTPEEHALVIPAVFLSLAAGTVIWMVIALLVRFHRNYLDVPANVFWHEGRFYHSCIPWLCTQYDVVRSWLYDGVRMLVSLPFLLVMAVCLITSGAMGVVFVLLSLVLACIAAFLAYSIGVVCGLGMVTVDTMVLLKPSHRIRPLEADEN